MPCPGLVLAGEMPGPGRVGASPAQPLCRCLGQVPNHPRGCGSSLPAPSQSSSEFSSVQKRAPRVICCSLKGAEVNSRARKSHTLILPHSPWLGCCERLLHSQIRAQGSPVCVTSQSHQGQPGWGCPALWSPGEGGPEPGAAPGGSQQVCWCSVLPKSTPGIPWSLQPGALGSAPGHPEPVPPPCPPSKAQPRGQLLTQPRAGQVQALHTWESGSSRDRSLVLP